MKVLIGGTPLESMGWQRDLGKVRLVWRDVSANDKAEFVRDLIATLQPLRMALLKEAVADGSYKPKEVDWDKVAQLPKPSMSGDELMALMRGDD
ncbi:hypothetical protein [Mesorhizobium sp.]|uniref:hypothetical protein n=1 Tax=Mesorhizobium sp. TaxID=1871066 RepID=UPI000FE48625|nr:hypothetical protein [Mesorhizobium sp.]RWI35508.1 MAG: hypothetical protein EOR14_28815 [Mesorhizobium sp.]RWJ66323.1 MAG: hypothetical protein EOR34_28320 [Mesorhizobium sp.]